MTHALNPFDRDLDVAYASIGSAFTVTLGKMLDGGREVDPTAELLPYVRAANIQDAGLSLEDVNTMPFTAAEATSLDLRRDDILVVEGGAVGTCVVLKEDLPGWSFQKTVNRLRPTGQWSSGFVAYVLRAYRDAGVIDIVCNRSTIPHLTAEKLRALRMPAFDPPLQAAISSFLDRETAQIDEVIAEQERLIELLQERRASVVDWCVWRGLEDSATAPTGIDPAPVAPSHWRRARNKELFFEATELSADGHEELLTVSHLTGVTPRSEKQVNMIEAESLAGYRRAAPGDLVVNTMWAWMGALGVSPQAGVVSPAYGVYRPREGAEVDSIYYDYLYRSRPYVVEMTRHSRGVWESRLRLYPEVFLRLPIVVPPLSEQRAIAAYLDEQTTRMDALIAEAKRLIELVQERRVALITTAVTGRIQVGETV